MDYTKDKIVAKSKYVAVTFHHVSGHEFDQ